MNNFPNSIVNVQFKLKKQNNRTAFRIDACFNLNTDTRISKCASRQF